MSTSSSSAAPAQPDGGQDQPMQHPPAHPPAPSPSRSGAATPLLDQLGEHMMQRTQQHDQELQNLRHQLHLASSAYQRVEVQQQQMMQMLQQQLQQQQPQPANAATAPAEQHLAATVVQPIVHTRELKLPEPREYRGSRVRTL